MYVKCNCNGECCKINIAQAGEVCPDSNSADCRNFALQLLNHDVNSVPQWNA